MLGGCRGEEPNCQNNALDHPFEYSATHAQFCTLDLSVIILTVK